LPLKKLDLPNWGRIDFNLQLSYLKKADFKALPTVQTLEQAGYYGVDVGTPYSKTRFNARASWTMGDYSLGLAWRNIGAASVQTTGSAANNAGKFQKVNETIREYNYFDLNGTWQATKNIKLSLTVNNLFDTQPPFIGTGIGPGSANYGNTFPSVYDVIGRRYTATVQANF
jgi:iron complex outermembrane recepter protein